MVPVPTDAARPAACPPPGRRAAPSSRYAPPLLALAAGPAWVVRHTRSYPGRPDQVRQVRSFLREVLDGYPRADDAVRAGSELAANSVLHSLSGIPGGTFTVRAEISGRQCTYVSVLDQGGHWDLDTCELVPEHGLDVVEGIAGPGNWGIIGDSSGHLVWARLLWPTDPSHLTWPETAVPHSGEDAETRAGLDKLATELSRHRLWTRLVSVPGQSPHLEVCDAAHPGTPERIYAQADWYFWPTAERIAARDDVTTAARAIAQALRHGTREQAALTDPSA